MNNQLVNMVFPPYIRYEEMTLEEAITLLWNMDLMNKGELHEVALVAKSRNQLRKHTKNKKGSDFQDGSDAKYAEVGYYGSSAYATLGGFKNKTGPLRVAVFEPKNNKNYFFTIPHEVYFPYTKNDDSLKFWFDKNGNPRDPLKSGRVNLWNYKCSSAEWAATK
jgi:hypothetical protein